MIGVWEVLRPGNAKASQAPYTHFGDASRLIDFENLAARELGYLFKIAAEIEQLALGGPTARIERFETPEQRHFRNVREAQRAYNEALQMFKNYDLEKLRLLIAQKVLISPTEL